MSRETPATPRRAAGRAGRSRATDAAGRIDLAVRNVRVLARGTIRALSLDENVPPEIAGALRDLAEAVAALAAALEDPGGPRRVREPALRAAAEATQVLERTGNLSVSVIVGQIRSTAADLLAATGMSYEQSDGRGAGGRPRGRGRALTRWAGTRCARGGSSGTASPRARRPGAHRDRLPAVRCHAQLMGSAELRSGRGSTGWPTDAVVTALWEDGRS